MLRDADELAAPDGRRPRRRLASRGWPARFPVVQFPNAPLLVALGGRALAASTGGAVHAEARGVFYVGLAAWAWEEMADGANPVRRAMGVAGLVYVVLEVGRALGG